LGRSGVQRDHDLPDQGCAQSVLWERDDQVQRSGVDLNGCAVASILPDRAVRRGMTPASVWFRRAMRLFFILPILGE
jgi:hypothetical protein